MSLKFFSLLLLLIPFQIYAQENLTLSCRVDLNGDLLEVLYTAPTQRMELTSFENGSMAGNSYGGHFRMTYNGEILIDKATDAVGEEYGVIILDGKLTYANLVVYDDTGTFSHEESFSVIIGRSFDDEQQIYMTDSKQSEISGGFNFPKSYKAKCQSTSSL